MLLGLESSSGSPRLSDNPGNKGGSAVVEVRRQTFSREVAPSSEPRPGILSDMSDLGWGALLGNLEVSGRWSSEEKGLHINVRELKGIHLGLQHFATQVHNKTIAVHADNTTP